MSQEIFTVHSDTEHRVISVDVAVVNLTLDLSPGQAEELAGKLFGELLEFVGSK